MSGDFFDLHRYFWIQRHTKTNILCCSSHRRVNFRNHGGSSSSIPTPQYKAHFTS